MISPELAGQFRDRYSDQAHLRLLDHALAWDDTFRGEIPEGWDEAGCTVYRMAMEYALRLLVEEDA